MKQRWMFTVTMIVVLLGALFGARVTGVEASGLQSPDDPPQDMMGRIAEKLGMTREALLEALLEGQTLRDVAEAQGVEIRPGAPGQARFLPREAAGEVIAAALDMTPDELQEAIRSGQTVPELVEAAGLDPAALAAEIKAAASADIQQAVADGDLDEDRAQAIIERLETSDAVERWLSGEGLPDMQRPSPRQLLDLGRTVYRWLQQHPGARRLLRRP